MTHAAHGSDNPILIISYGANLYNLPSNGVRDANRTTFASTTFVVFLLGSLCLTRPSLFGQDYNFIGGFAIIATTAGYLFTRTGAAIELARPSAALNTAIALCVLWSYVFTASIFFGQSDTLNLLKACAGAFGVTICLLLLSLNGDLLDRAFPIFARLNSVLGYSSAVTSALIPIVGYSSLRILSYSIGGYEDASSEGGNGDVLLPFSVVYSTLKEYGITRYCGIYREAGIAQAYYVWSAIYLMYSRARIFWIVGSIFGAVLCGSTAVVFSIAAACLVHFGSRSLSRPRELLLLVVVLAILVPVAIYTPGLGIIDKMATHGASMSDRQVAMEMALPGTDLWRWLIGHGLFYTGLETAASTGINAISGIFSIGAIGFVLYLATFFAAPLRATTGADAFRYLTLLSPMLITSLLFQPVIDAPLVMALLFCLPPTMRNTELHSQQESNKTIRSPITAKPNPATISQ